MFHRITLTATAALLAAGPALAGGFANPVVVAAPSAPVIVPAAPVVVASTDWSGGYVGGQLGFGRLSLDNTNTTTGDTREDVAEGNGALFGAHAGYMFDFGRLVVGAEVDYDLTRIDIDGDEEVFQGEYPFGELDSIARAKLRVGFDAGRVLPYVTAGLARASVNFDEGFVEDVGDLEDPYNGRFIGVGASFAMRENFMVGIEALRHEFENLPDSAEGAPVDDQEQDTMINTLTLRGSFRF